MEIYLVSLLPPCVSHCKATRFRFTVHSLMCGAKYNQARTLFLFNQLWICSLFLSYPLRICRQLTGRWKKKSIKMLAKDNAVLSLYRWGWHRPCNLWHHKLEKEPHGSVCSKMEEHFTTIGSCITFYSYINICNFFVIERFPIWH